MIIVGKVLFIAGEAPVNINFWLIYNPILIIGFTLLDGLIKNDETWLSGIGIGVIIHSGVDYTIITLIEDNFIIIPLWLVHYIALFTISIVHGLDWKKVIIGLFGVQAFYLTTIHIKFGILDIYFYIGETTLLVFFPMLGIGISKLMKDLILTLQENKELISTIQNILKVLPESVIVNGFDSNANKMALKYANNCALRNFIIEGNTRNFDNSSGFKDFTIKIVKNQESHHSHNSDCNHELEVSSEFSMAGFLDFHEHEAQYKLHEVVSSIEVQDGNNHK